MKQERKYKGDPAINPNPDRYVSILSAIGEPEPRHCRVCGCTDDDCVFCIALTGEPCSWVDEDLCSACAPLDSAKDRRLRAEDCIAAAVQMLERAQAQIPAGNKKFNALETALRMSHNAVTVALSWVWRGGK